MEDIGVITLTSEYVNGARTFFFHLLFIDFFNTKFKFIRGDRPYPFIEKLLRLCCPRTPRSSDEFNIELLKHEGNKTFYEPLHFTIL